MRSQAPSHKQTAWWRWVIGVLFFFLAGWGAVELLDPDESPESWLLLRLFHPGPFNVAIEVNLEVAGKPVRLERIFECKARFTSRITGRLRPGWYSNRYMISERLPDQSGIMVVIPDVCDHLKPVPADFVPLVMWTANASHPDEIEAFVDPELLTSGTSHVKFERISVTWPAEAEVGQYPNDFMDIVGNPGKNPQPQGTLTRYVAYFAYPVPSAYWSKQVPELTALQGQLPIVYPINGDRRLHDRLAINTNQLADALGGVYLPIRSNTAPNIHDIALSKVMPFTLQEGSRLEISRQQKGRLVFYRSGTVCAASLEYIDAVESSCAEAPFPELKRTYVLGSNAQLLLLGQLPSLFILRDTL